MANRIIGKEYSLSKIFCKDFEFNIPSYQRPYSWEETQTETLFDNLYEFYKENSNDDYFLGSIVLIKEDNIPKSDVIDGQQRLTTLTILFSVLASKLSGQVRDECKGYILEKGSIIEKIPEKPRITLRDKDQDFFNKYIQNVNIDDLLKLDIATLPNESQIHIRNNCEVINNKITKYFGTDIEELTAFCVFLATKCYLVVVSTDNRNSAFRIFSVMNSTGLDLSPTDIIKSEVIGKIKDSEQQDYTNKWEDLEIKTTRQGFSELFSHIRMIYTKAKAKKSLLDEFKENVVDKYDPKEIIDSILEPYANYYSQIKKGNYKTSSFQDEINESLMWLNKIDNSDWTPSTIKFLSKYNNSPEYVQWFLSKMERLTSFLNITGKDVNERIERYADILDELETDDSDINNPIKKIELSDEEKNEFIKKLDGEIYKMPSKRRNYVILRLDSFIADGGASYNPTLLTIEHVLPQTVDDVSEWAKVWPDEEKRKIWLNRIANLVPLTRRKNSEAQNYDFKIKKEKYFMSPKGTSSYALTSQVLACNSWDESKVESRQKELLEVFKEKWKL